MSRPRRIVVNTAIHLHGTSGSSTATRALVAALRCLDDAEVHEVAPRERGGRGAVRNAWADARWDLWQAPRSVPDVDLHVSPVNIGRGGPARRHLLVVYDVMIFDRPDLFDRWFAAYFKLLVPPSLRSADRVLTLSDHAAARLRKIAPRADVRVIPLPHHGLADETISVPEHRVVLMVGATEPVKNQVAGVDAVAALRAQTGVDVRLRVIGPAGRAEDDLRERLAAVDPSGVWTSREVDVPRAVLESAYREAWLLLQPSHDEGYGLPLVEASRFGVPAVHSGRGAMPSVMPSVDAGGVTPGELVRAMTPLLDEPTWAAAASGARRRAADFTPERFRSAIASHVEDLLGAVP